MDWDSRGIWLASLSKEFGVAPWASGCVGFTQLRTRYRIMPRETETTQNVPMLEQSAVS